MTEDIFEGPGFPGTDGPGRSPDRFQVMVRLDRSLPEPLGNGSPGALPSDAALEASERSLSDIAASLGGRIEKRLVTENTEQAGGKGSIYVLSFPDTPARDAIVNALSNRPGIDIAELDSTVHVLLASTDTHYLSGAMWGMLGPVGDGIGAFGNEFGSGADVAWADAAVSADGKAGSMRTVIGVIDTGIDPLHPDLYLNIWINQNEIPEGLASDQDGDGIITFRDLNVMSTAGYVNAVNDINANGYIDADDILRDSAWANGIDDDSNGYTDDLFGWDFFGNDNRPFESYRGGSAAISEPADSYHGTHVAGTIGALANTGGVVGVAWDVQVMPLRFLGPPGFGGSTSNAILALNYYAAMGAAHADLDFVGTNNSWGGGGASILLANAIKLAGDKGHLFVVAAGNDAQNTDSSPNYPSTYAVTSIFEGVSYDPVISVASIASNGDLSTFSNFGAVSVDLAAPGTTIASTFAGNEWFNPPFYSYANLSGTSMASPHVAGAAALIASEFPGLHPADLRAVILGGATAYGALSGRVATGGRLNIPGSIALVGPSPVITIDDTLLSLADGGATVTFTFSEAVTGFSAADISVTPGHGAISGLATSNNLVWTATFTPANVETQDAQILVGNRFTAAAGGKPGREGESAAFSIDRIAPTVTIATIGATEQDGGAQVSGTLSGGLATGDKVLVYRDGSLIGEASVNGAAWQFDDATTLADGTYQYTARVIDAAGNPGALSGQGTLVVDTIDADFVLALNTPESGHYGNGFGGASDADGVVTGVFEGTAQNLVLTLTGFDIDGVTETLVYLNGAQIGNLAVTPNYGTGPSAFTIPSSQQLVGTNTLTFVNKNAAWLWGLTDILLEPASTADFELEPGTLVTASFGNQFNGLSDADGQVSAGFQGADQDLVLTLSGYDIDGPDETRVLLNGAPLGYLAPTPNNGSGPSSFTILASQQQAGENVITFVNKNAAWKWGFTDVLLDFAPTADFTLDLGVLETGHFGNGFGGAADADGIVTAGFSGTAQDLLLTLTGFDIDGVSETQVLLNGAHFGWLTPTPNNGTGPTELTILASQQAPGTNTLTFVNKNAAWLWGFTDVLIEPATIA